MHITIIFGTIIGSGTLLLFLSLKSIADVVMHIVEHMFLGTSTSTKPPID